MANNAVASWKKCIKTLQQLIGDTCTAPDTSTACFAAAKGVVEKFAEADDIPLPNAAWKKLVHDVQVLYPFQEAVVECCMHSCVLVLLLPKMRQCASTGGLCSAKLAISLCSHW
jgi:hypothetical protein